MDPVTVKFVQLILAELFGAGLCVAGIWATFKGVSGQMNLLVQGGNLKGKLVNGSPGFLLAALGVFLIVWSLSTKVKQETAEIRGPVADSGGPSEPGIYDYWLANASKLSGDEPIDQIMTTLLGPNPAANAVVTSIWLDKDMTLAEIATAEYGGEKYWPILARANRHLPSPITEKTTVMHGKPVRVARRSKFHGMERKTVLEIKREDKHRTLDELLTLAKTTKSLDEVGIVSLMQDYKKKEVYLAMTPLTPSGGVTNLGELSLQIYGDKKTYGL